MQLTKNFTDDEFKCPCCGKKDMDRVFVEALQKARDIAGIPFQINSGWRCMKHNKEVGGKSNSSHLLGLAADIQAETSYKRLLIVDGLLRAGCVRIGIAQGFVHVDDDIRKPLRVMWLY